MPCKIVGLSEERKFLGTKVPRNEKELSFPGNESSRERKGPGTKVPGNFRSPPGNEKSRERKFPIGTIRSWERKVLGTKSPGTGTGAASMAGAYVHTLAGAAGAWFIRTHNFFR